MRRRLLIIAQLNTDNFLAANEPPYDVGPAPPPGPSLLDDTESNMLESFFTTLNTGQFNVNDAWFQDLSHDKGGGAFGLDWTEGLPPNLEGSTTSLSQPPIHSMNPQKNNNQMGGMGPDSDILAAAQMLYGNGANTMNFATGHLFPAGMPEMAPNHMPQPRIKQEQTHHPPTNHNDPRQMIPQGQHTSVFNPEQPAFPVDPHTTIEVHRLRWGSDAGFVDQGYRRPAEMENTEEVTKNLLENMKCLEPQSSTTNTRAPTPTKFETPHNSEWNNGNGVSTSQSSDTTNYDEGDGNSRPRKRSKIKMQEDDDSDDNSSTPRIKKMKGASGGKARRGSSESSSKRAKAQQASKAARENLTEEQKRTNHILSEQKRRNLIKQGFDELCALVPDLRGGGFSKSAMLIQAADYLEEILIGNNELRKQLSQLKTVNGFMIPR